MSENSKLLNHFKDSKKELHYLGVISNNIVDMIFRLEESPESFDDKQIDLMLNLQKLVLNHLEKLSYEAENIDLDIDYFDQIEYLFALYTGKLSELCVMAESVIDMVSNPQTSISEMIADQERIEMIFDLQIILADHISKFRDVVAEDFLTVRFHEYYGS